MKAAVYNSPKDMRIQEIETPKIAPNEALVEMKACGICGSDLMPWYLEKRAPLVLGHEPAGVITEAGSKVEGFRQGERVFVHHHVACLTCHYCRHGAYTMCQRFAGTHLDPGGFAEYFRVPAENLEKDTLRIPDNVSFEEATLIEPIGCGIRAVNKCEIKPGDTIAIIGAGPAGVINTILARLSGAGQVLISDTIDYRLKTARKFGADLAVNVQASSFAEAVKSSTEGRGADVVMVTAPSVKAYDSALEICRKGGTVCAFAPTTPEEAVPISPHRLFFREIKLIPSYSTSHLETRMALELIRTSRISAKDLITHRFPLARADEAFQTAAENKKCLKVVILNEK